MEIVLGYLGEHWTDSAEMARKIMAYENVVTRAVRRADASSERDLRDILSHFTDRHLLRTVLIVGPSKSSPPSEYVQYLMDLDFKLAPHQHSYILRTEIERLNTACVRLVDIELEIELLQDRARDEDHIDVEITQEDLDAYTDMLPKFWRVASKNFKNYNPYRVNVSKIERVAYDIRSELNVDKRTVAGDRIYEDIVREFGSYDSYLSFVRLISKFSQLREFDPSVERIPDDIAKARADLDKVQSDIEKHRRIIKRVNSLSVST